MSLKCLKNFLKTYRKCLKIAKNVLTTSTKPLKMSEKNIKIMSKMSIYVY